MTGDGYGTGLAGEAFHRPPAYLARQRNGMPQKIKSAPNGGGGDIEAAKHKLRKRYPDCEILEGKEK